MGSYPTGTPSFPQLAQPRHLPHDTHRQARQKLQEDWCKSNNKWVAVSVRLLLTLSTSWLSPRHESWILPWCRPATTRRETDEREKRDQRHNAPTAVSWQGQQEKGCHHHLHRIASTIAIVVTVNSQRVQTLLVLLGYSVSSGSQSLAR